MSRSGLVDDDDGDPLAYGRWRAQVASSIRGQRGQKALKEILAALDAMPVKELCKNNLVSADGQYCTLGVLGASRGIDLADIDPDDREYVAKVFDIAEALAAEIMWYNDEYIEDSICVPMELCGPVRPHRPDYGNHSFNVYIKNENEGKDRWKHMRDWVASKII